MKNEMPNLQELIEMPEEGKELARKIREIKPEFNPDVPFAGCRIGDIIDDKERLGLFIKSRDKYEAMWKDTIYKNLGVDYEFLHGLGFSRYTLEHEYLGDKAIMVGAVEKLFGNDLTDRTIIAFRTYSDDANLSKTFAGKNAKTISYGNYGYAPNSTILGRVKEKPENEKILYGTWNEFDDEVKVKADIMVFSGDQEPCFGDKMEEDEERPERKFGETNEKYWARRDEWRTNYETRIAKMVDNSLKPGGVFLQGGKIAVENKIFANIGYTVCRTEYFTIVQKPKEE